MIKQLLFSLLFSTCASLVNAQDNGAVCGSIYNDQNGNGIYDNDETGVQGISILITAAPAGEDTLMLQTTDVDGNFCFSGLMPGVYTFMIEVPQGWQLTGDSNSFTVTVIDDMMTGPYRYGLRRTAFVENVSENLFSIYPNPATSEFNLKLNSLPENCELTLFDLSGKQLLHHTITGINSVVNTANLSSGMYIAKVKTGNITGHIKLLILR